MTQDSNPPLYFHCNMCGECCSSWNIPMEGHKATQLLTKPWAQARLNETRRTLVKLSEDFYRIPLTDENVCVFLAEDRRCMIEMHEGLTLKPKECQRFPFATIKMPDGSHRHETSAACKLVSEKLLLAFQPILPKPAINRLSEDSLEALQQHEDAQFDEVGILPAHIPIHLWDKMTIASYDTYLTQLHQLFSEPNQHPDGLLKTISQYLAQQKRVTSTNYPSSTFRIPAGLSHWAVLLFIRKPYRTLNWINLLSGRHYHDPRIFGMPISLKQQRAIPWSSEHNRLLNAFLYQILQRKRLLASGSSLSALLAMATIASLLVQWYAKTLAWLQESNEISVQDVSTAIRLVERYYTGHQPRFMQFFTSQWKSWILVKILLR